MSELPLIREKARVITRAQKRAGAGGRGCTAHWTVVRRSDAITAKPFACKAQKATAIRVATLEFIHYPVLIGILDEKAAKNELNGHLLNTPKKEVEYFVIKHIFKDIGIKNIT